MILLHSFKLISLEIACFFSLFIHKGMQRHPPSSSWRLPGVGLTEEKKVGDREAPRKTNRPCLIVIVPKDKIRQVEVPFVGTHSLRS